MASSDRPHDPRITVIQQELFDESKSKVAKYQELVVGRSGLGALVAYELVMLCASWLPGALGLFLRGKLYPLLLGRVGRNVVFGANVTLRHPHKIAIGDNVVVDDQCCLDAKGTDLDLAAQSENHMIIGQLQSISYTSHLDIRSCFSYLAAD